MRRKMEHLREEREQIRQLRNVSQNDLPDLPFKMTLIWKMDTVHRYYFQIFFKIWVYIAVSKVIINT